MDVTERRFACRIPVVLPARCSSPASAVDGWVSDLSRSGMFLRTEKLDKIGSAYRVELNLPDEPDPLELRGEVVRVDPTPQHGGVAIRFTVVHPQGRRRLANFMMERNFQTLA